MTRSEVAAFISLPPEILKYKKCAYSANEWMLISINFLYSWEEIIFLIFMKKSVDILNSKW